MRLGSTATPSAEPLPAAESSSTAGTICAEPLRLCYRSLVETGQRLIADGRLADLLRRVAAFGLTLVRLDVRQHAARHAEALDAITRALGAGRLRGVDRRAARRRSCCASCTSRAAARSRRTSRRRRGPRGARDVPHVAATAGRVARRLRHLDGQRAVRRAGRRAAAESSGHRRAAARRAALRDGRRPARRRRHPARAAGAPWYRAPDRRPAGSDGRLLRFGEGRRPARGELGALPGAGGHRRRVRARRGRADAVPRPRRQRRPRRRPDLPGDPVAAARVDRRPAARHRAGRDDPGAVRPARHRRADAGGLHDRDARGDARAAGARRGRSGATRWSGSPPTSRARLPRRRLRGAAVRRRTSAPRRRSRSSGRCTIGSRPARRGTAAAASRALRAIPWVFAWTQTRLLLPSWLGIGEALAGAIARGDRERAARRCTATGRSSARRST